SSSVLDPEGVVTVPVQLFANGNENAVSFSLNFDPALLTYQTAALGSGLEGGNLLLNSSQVGNGKLGIAVAMSTALTFEASTQQLVIVSFNSPIVIRPTSTSIGFGDAPIKRLVT